MADQRRPRLLIVIGTLRGMGGAERQAVYLAGHLASLGGCHVEVLSFEDGTAVRPYLDELRIPVHVVPYYFRWPRARRARTLAKLGLMLRTTVKPDALLPFVGVHSKTAAQVWPLTAARYCWWNQQDEGRDLTGTAAEGRILRKVSRITSNSFAGRDFLASTYGLDPSTIAVYNNGTPVPETTDPALFRASLNAGPRPLVSMIANISKFKDHATLLNAWRIVKGRYAGDMRPLLLLAGSLSDAETVAALKTQAFDSGLSDDDVRFLGAVSNVADVIAVSDLVVHSSLTEGCPNAVCEAMALSRAVVATDIPGCRQALGDDAREAFAGPRDPASLADKITALLNDGDLRSRAGQRNRRRIERDFTIDGMNVFFQREIERGLGVSLA